MAPQQYFLPSTSAEYKNKSLEGRRKASFFPKATQMASTTQNWPTNRLSQNITPPHFAPSPAELPLSPPVHSKPILPIKIHFLLPILLILAALTISPISGQTTGKCYSFAPGLSIVGADYRRDFGLSRRQCADVCKTDVCCMAFEWRRDGGQCTLKSRSLNGTVVQMPAAPQEEGEIGEKADEGQKTANQAAPGDVFFALCLDYGDSERDRFWDHELGGLVVASVGSVGREKCAQFCTEFNANGGTVEKRSAATGMELEESNETRGFFAGHHGGRRGKRPSRSAKSANTPSAVIYSWRTMDPTDMEAPTGECQCISVLQHIRLSFGSFAGFLI